MGVVVGAAEIIGHEDVTEAGKALDEYNEQKEIAEQALNQTGKWAPSVNDDPEIATDRQDCDSDAARLNTAVTDNQQLASDVSNDLPSISDFYDNYDQTKADGGFSDAQIEAVVAEISAIADDYGAVSADPDPSVAVTQLEDDFGNLQADTNSLLYMPLTMNAASATTTSTAAGMMAVGDLLYAALEAADGTIQRFTFHSLTGISFFLSPDTFYKLTVFDPTTLSLGQIVFESSGSGRDQDTKRAFGAADRLPNEWRP